MRRIVFEYPRDDFIRLKGDLPFYAALASLEVLQILRAGPGGASMIVLLRPKDPHQKFEQLARSVPARLQLLEAGEGTFTCLMRVPSGPFTQFLGSQARSGLPCPANGAGGRHRSHDLRGVER